MILVMVMIGGITRLTGSGLSITEWKVISGTLPPLSDAEWNNTFEKYKQTPEFKIKNSDMQLEGFKSIFFWEYFHRLWGRVMGLVFFFPFMYFTLKGYFKPNSLTRKMWLVLILGALQGGLGWFMVASGLVDKPHVDHFRLTAHLLMATLLLVYLMWLIYDIEILEKKYYKTSAHSYGKHVGALVFILALQLVYGGFMAGKKAALFYPTYPDMNGEIIPSGLWVLDSLNNFTDNITMIHFMHRLLPWVVVSLFIYVYLRLKRNQLEFERLKGTLHFFVILLLIQITLGIKTVLLNHGSISVFWGTTHQLTGIVVFLCSWWLWMSLTRVSSSAAK